MNETLYLICTFTAGLILGAFFFAGLWLTVKKGAITQSPALLFLASFLLRTSITMLGLYYIAAGSLQRLLICVLGFVTARFVVVRLTKTNEKKQMLLKSTQSDCE